MAEFFGDLERLAADLYPWRYLIGTGILIVIIAVAAYGYRKSWHLWVWQHRLPVASVGTPLLALVGFIAYDLGSPLFTNVTIEEEFPFAFSAVVPVDMTRDDVEQTMSALAKMDQQAVDEPMPDMAKASEATAVNGPPSAPTPAPMVIESPTSTATAPPTRTPTATSVPIPTPEGFRAGQQIESSIQNFMLEELTVEVGAIIDWANLDSASHTTTAGSPGNVTGQWDSGSLSQGDSFSFTFDEVGVFPYFCEVHPSTMQAIVTVVARPEPTSTPMPTPTATSTPVPTSTPTPAPTTTAVPPTPESTAQAQAGPVKLKEGNFRDADSFHKGSGQATIYRGPDGTLLLRLENFNVTNGPELHVILSPHPNPQSQSDLKAPGYVDLGKLKGNRGNQNYTIPNDVDVGAQGSVVIYCSPFHVIFSVATLQDAG